jgi:SSS family solute:Na+ symporter
MPVIVVLPGIAAYVLHQQGMFQTEMLDSKGNLDVNKAYPSLLNLLPMGLKGLSFAALTAAIVASLAGKANSISTIFILDIYKKAINKNASEQRQVFLGRLTVVVAMTIAVFLALMLGGKLMGEGKQGFQYIQEYTGFVSPGIFAMFFLGFFWKKTTSNAALFATIGGFLFSVILKSLPGMTDLSFLAPIGFSKDNGHGVYEIPFLDRMGITFLLCILGMWIISLIEIKRGVVPKGLEIDKKMFKVDARFAIGAIIAIGLLAALYIAYW